MTEAEYSGWALILLPVLVFVILAGLGFLGDHVDDNERR